MLRIFISSTFVTVNFIAIVALVHTLHRIVSIGPDDFGGTGALIGAFVSLIPLGYLGKSLSEKIRHRPAHEYSNNALALLGVNLLALVIILTLYCCLPLMSQSNARAAEKLYAAGKLNSAIHAYHKAIYQNPDNAAALAALGSIYEETKNLEKAQHYYSLAIRYDTHSPKSIAPFNHFARLLIKIQRFDDAIEILLKAESALWQQPAKQNPALAYRQGVIAKNLSWAYFLAGDHAKAKNAAIEALALLEQAGKISQYPEVYCLLALANPSEQSNAYLQSCELGYQTQVLESLDIKLLRDTKMAVEQHHAQ